MGKTLWGYLLREIGGAFAAGIAILTFVLFVARVIDLLEMIFARGVPGLLVLRLLACIIPTFLEATLPMSFLLGTVVALGRMSADGEVTALRAAGIDAFQILRPVLVAALLVSAATLALAMTARPWGHRELERTAFEIAKTRASAALRPRFFNADFENMVVYVDRIDPDTGRLFGVVLSDERPAGRATTVFAKSGHLGGREDSGSLFLQLADGTSVAADRVPLDSDVTSFGSLEVTLQLRTATTRLASKGEPGAMSWSEIRHARGAGDPRAAREATIELNRRLAISAAPLVLALLALPLGMQTARSARSHGTGVGIGAILLYYALLSFSIALARSGTVAPAPAPWAADGLFAAAALWMLARVARDRRPWPPLPFGAALLRLAGARERGH